MEAGGARLVALSSEVQQPPPQSGPVTAPPATSGSPATPVAAFYAQLLAAAGQPGIQQAGLTYELVGTYMAAFSGMTPDRQRQQMVLVAVALGAGPKALAPLLRGVAKIASMRPAGGFGQ